MVLTKFTVPENSLEKWPIPSLSSETKNSNSWFDIIGRSHNNKVNVVNNKKVLRCDAFILKLNKNQITTINEWFEICRQVYNRALKYVKINGLVSEFMLVKLLKQEEDVVTYLDKKKIPCDVVDNAIKDVIKSYTSAIGLSNTTGKGFRIRYKKLNANKCLTIESKAFSKVKNTFYVRFLGKKIKLKKKTKKETKNIFNNINHACKLVYKKGKYLLYIPKDKNTYTVDSKIDISLDPGVRTFQTAYQSDGNIIEYGNNVSKKLTGYFNKLDKKAKYQDCAWYRRYQKRINKRIHNLVTDLHWKCAKDIVKKSKAVFIGNMSTKSICSKNNKLDEMVKRNCYALSHYTFRMRLKQKCEQYNVQFTEVDESYTSKTCGSCGKLHDNLKGNKIFKCPSCPFVIGRDHNGARNIMIKSNL